jgi:hypothetical protein
MRHTLGVVRVAAVAGTAWVRVAAVAGTVRVRVAAVAGTVRVRVAAVAAVVATALAVLAAPAQALPPGETVPITGTFSMTTANGVLPTWEADDIALVGVSPGAVTTTATSITARLTLPLVAKTGTAYAAAGGFRLLKRDTGATIRCSTPTIDTAARLLDCILPDGSQEALFLISDIDSRSRVWGTTTVTSVFRGVEMRINGQEAADLLNKALGVKTFSPSITIGTGDLIAARPR